MRSPAGPIRWLFAAALSSAAPGVGAHDIYGELRDSAGRLCCGGDPVTGDCEPVAYVLRPDGDAEMHSSRHGAWIRVASSRITWIALDGSTAEAHWCGRPRRRAIRAPTISADDPDPDFVTFCAFIAPRES